MAAEGAWNPHIGRWILSEQERRHCCPRILELDTRGPQAHYRDLYHIVQLHNLPTECYFMSILAVHLVDKGFPVPVVRDTLATVYAAQRLTGTIITVQAAEHYASTIVERSCHMTTSIQREELAYNTYGGGHSRSNRRGRVRFPDGKIRIVTLGVPDTYFSIPAHAHVRGKYVSGTVMVDYETHEFAFFPAERYRHMFPMPEGGS